MIDFELANRHTQNSLLKTLEEPPGSVILILTAESASSLFETVSSRCEEIKLNPVPIQTTRKGLYDQYQIPEDRADFLAHISGGKPELALEYHQEPEILERRNNLLDQHYEILGQNSVARFAYANQLIKDPLMVQEMLTIWSSIWHDVLLQAGKSDTPIQNIDREVEIKTIDKAVDLQVARKTINLFRHAHGLLQKNANLKLTVEDLLIRLTINVFCKTVLEQTHGSLDYGTAFSSIAEQFGRERHGGHSLRDLSQTIRMDEVTSVEPHELSTVLSSALYEMLVNIFEERLAGLVEQEGDRFSDPSFSLSGKALALSAQQLARMIFRALDYLPPGEISFADYGRAILAPIKLVPP